MVRGAWLVFLELTYLRLAWTFNLDFPYCIPAGVIWMLGWCMVLMALLSRLPVSANGAFGLLIILGHNTVAALIDPNTPTGDLWRILYFGGAFSPGGAANPNFFVLYSLIPGSGS